MQQRTRNLTCPGPAGTWEHARTWTADVVVLGAGHAGTTAARSAAEAGASVLVAEQLPEARFFVSGAGFGSINSRCMRKHGVPFQDPDAAMQILQRTMHAVPQELLRAFVQSSGETYDWFLEPLTDAVQQRMIIAIPGGSAARRMPGLGTAIFYGSAATPDMTPALQCSQAAAKKLGAQFLFGLDSIQLRTEPGRNLSLTVTAQEGVPICLTAVKGVILAAKQELKVDSHQQVLDAYGHPIPGLFAPGGICTPDSGIAVGMAYTLGRRVGEYVARLKSPSV